MRYTGIQPHYFPRLHFFARILSTDTFVIRDDVQFVRKHKYPDGKTGKSYQAHTPIKKAEGVHLLMVPIIHNGKKPINKTEVQYSNGWIETHLKTIEIFYRKSHYFSNIFPEIKAILTKQYKTLAELNIATILWGLLRLAGLQKVSGDQLTIDFVLQTIRKRNIFRVQSIRKASESKSLTKLRSVTPNEKIIALIKEVGANEDYCGGTGVAAYMDKNLFKQHGITITVQDWKCKSYSQLYTKKQGFIPNLSVIDLLMNVSTEEAIAVIRG